MRSPNLPRGRGVDMREGVAWGEDVAKMEPGKMEFFQGGAYDGLLRSIKMKQWKQTKWGQPLKISWGLTTHLGLNGKITLPFRKEDQKVCCWSWRASGYLYQSWSVL